MEIGVGQSYTASAENISIPTTPTSFDLLQITAASGVPLLLSSIIYTGSVLTGTILRILLVLRSAASTGGTALTGTNDSPAGPAHSATVSYLNTTLGSLIANSTKDSWEWNAFAPYQFERSPGGILIAPGVSASLYTPAAPAAGIQGAFKVNFTEFK